MNRDKFECKEAKRSGTTVEQLREFYEITPCECGEKGCKGWRARYRFRNERRRKS